METTRQLKIARLIQKDLGDILLFESRNLFGGSMITVTKVRVSKDLAVARVYVSLFATADKPKLLEAINKHNKEIRHKLALRIGRQVRIIPGLEFFMDDSLDYIDHIEELL